MTGQEHYKAAEELLRQLSRPYASEGEGPVLAMRAQAHAMLALAAVTALPTNSYRREKRWLGTIKPVAPEDDDS